MRYFLLISILLFAQTLEEITFLGLAATTIVPVSAMSMRDLKQNTSLKNEILMSLAST